MRVPAVAVALWLVPTLAMPQSLGEAARKQARKRSAGDPATKVYTDTDLRPSGEGAEGVPAETPTEASALTGGATTALAASGKTGKTPSTHQRVDPVHCRGRLSDDPLGARVNLSSRVSHSHG